MNVLKTTAIVIALTCSCLFVYSQGTTSEGTEFWTAYMANTNPPGGGQGSVMDIYITSDVNTSGNVAIADGSFSKNFSVTANKVTIITIPPGAFINSQGTFNEGIHITSLKPVAVYAHIFAEDSSGATLLLPVSSLGKDYYSINYTQKADETAYSTFMVIATEDNTTVEITPSNELINNVKTPFTVTLNKGQVYQGMSSLDLTGTRIESVSSGTNTCKPIAVFSGSTRMQIGCIQGDYSSDNLFQQVYPTASWGKNYITIPLKGRDYDIFRIVLSNPNSNVTLNGNVIPLNQFKAGLYYEFDSSTPNYITSDQPIQVVQYAVSQGNGVNCTQDPKDIGDPEMIYLTPLEQTLNSVTLYSTSNYLILQSYINVIIKTSAAKLFKIDGSPVITKQIFNVPGDTSYSYMQLMVPEGTHTLVSPDGFNAIAYGFGEYESYGYAAGTDLKDLSNFVSLGNPQTGVTQTNGCSGVNYNLQVTVPFKTTNIKWSFSDGSDPYVDSNPVIVKSVQNGDETLYTYNYPKDPVSYKNGDYAATATVTIPVAGVCGSAENVELDYTISDPPVAGFSYANTDLGTIAFTDKTTSSNLLKSWNWDFGDKQASDLENPSHSYLYAGNYNVSLTVTDADGCTSTYQSPVLVPMAVRGIQGISTTCQGTASASPNIEQFTLSGIGLTDDITAAAPPGFEVSLEPGGGYSNSITINKKGSVVDSANVYVRLAASAQGGTISGNVVLSSNGQTSLNIPVTGVVNTAPTIDPIPDQTLVNG